MTIREIAAKFLAGFEPDPGTSDLDDEQPITVRVTLGDWRTLDRALAVPERSPTAAALVARQAEDAGLWFVAATASEAYLQRALRELHAAVEADGTNPAAVQLLREINDDLVLPSRWQSRVDAVLDAADGASPEEASAWTPPFDWTVTLGKYVVIVDADGSFIPPDEVVALLNSRYMNKSEPPK